jgi:hypothetical protein
MRAEFQALVDEFTSEAHKGEHWTIRLDHGVSALAKLAGSLVDAVDSENRDAELPVIEGELREAAEQLIDKVELPVWVGVPVSAAIPAVCAAVVKAAANKSSSAEVFRDQVVVPAIDKTVLWLLKQRNSLAPDAPPFVAVPVVPATA